MNKKSKKSLLSLLLLPMLFGTISASLTNNAQVSNPVGFVNQIKKANSFSSVNLENAPSLGWDLTSADNTYDEKYFDKGILRYYCYDAGGSSGSYHSSFAVEILQRDNVFVPGNKYNFYFNSNLISDTSLSPLDWSKGYNFSTNYQYQIYPTSDALSYFSNLKFNNYAETIDDTSYHRVSFEVKQQIPNNIKLFDILLGNYNANDMGYRDANYEPEGEDGLIFINNVNDAWNKHMASFTDFVRFRFVDNSLIDGASKDIYLNVDSNYSMQTILSQVTAQDLFGQPCTVTVDTANSNYVAGQIGDFVITIKATDNYGQSASATLNVHVLDYTAPVITKIADVKAPASTGLSEAQFMSHLSISDNVTSAESISVSLTLPTGFGWNKALNVGTYNVVVTAKDDANRTTSLTVPVSIVDDIAPTITRRDGSANTSVIKVGVSGINDLLESNLLSFYKFNDNVTSTEKLSVGIIDSTIEQKVGIYTAKIVVTDEAENKAIQEINVEVIQDLPPVFILSEALVVCDIVTPLSVDDIKQVASYLLNTTADQVDLIDSASDIKNYLAESDVAGEYRIQAYSRESQQFITFKLQVNDVELKKSEVRGWSWVTSFFQSLGLSIKKIFTEFKFEWKWVLNGREIQMDK